MSWEDEDFDDYPEEFEESCTITCSNCGAEVYEDCEMCPVCHEYILRTSNPLTGKPSWYIVTAILGIIAVIVAMLLSAL